MKNIFVLSCFLALILYSCNDSERAVSENQSADQAIAEALDKLEGVEADLVEKYGDILRFEHHSVENLSAEQKQEILDRFRTPEDLETYREELEEKFQAALQRKAAIQEKKDKLAAIKTDLRQAGSLEEFKAILYQNEAFKVSGNGRMIEGEEARRAYFEEENPYHLSALLKKYGHLEWVDEEYDMYGMEGGQ